MNNIKYLAHYLFGNNKVLWIREENREQIVSDFTMSDFNFLIGRKKGRLILKPLKDLTLDIFKDIFGGEITSFDVIRDGDDLLDFYIEYSYHDGCMPLSYLDTQKLLGLGYDLFGLITTGDAISIHDVNKELL